MTNATATIGLSWDTETGILEDNGGNECQLSEMLADVVDGSLREMIESWTCEPLAGEALEDYEALCDVIRDAARDAKAVETIIIKVPYVDGSKTVYTKQDDVILVQQIDELENQTDTDELEYEDDLWECIKWERLAALKRAFVHAAHEYYCEHTQKSFEDLNLEDYHNSGRYNWADGLDGSEFASIKEAMACGEEAASQAIEAEQA